MGFFHRRKKAIPVSENVSEMLETVSETSQREAQYFTETGFPNESFLESQKEVPADEYYALCNQLRTAPAIYCPCSRRTGEPYLYMDVLKDEQGYGFTKTRIQLWTEEENERLSQKFSRPDVQIIRLEEGESGRRIPGFLGTAFYENGAEFAEINGAGYYIAAEDVLPRPDLSQLPEQQRPVLNPEVMRWQCLLGQLNEQENPLHNDLQELYLDKFGKALSSARVLLPLLTEDDITKADAKFSLPAWKGREGRECVRVFTDWRRLQRGMDPEKKWSAKTETTADLIGHYDVIVNNSSFHNFSIYITPSFYDMFCNNQPQ